MEPTESQIWEKKDNETSLAWTAFTVYRDMGKDRSMTLAVKDLGRSPGYRRTLEMWSKKYNWVERCHAYDRYFDQMQTQANLTQSRNTFQAKKQAQLTDRERIGRTLINVSLRMIQAIQGELTERLRNPVPMKAADVAALLRASVSALELGDTMVNNVIAVEAESQNEIAAREESVIDRNDPEALAREYRRIINNGHSG